MIQQAFISGQLGKAIYLEGGRYFVLDVHQAVPVECHPIDVSSFFCFGAEVNTISDITINLTNLRSTLKDQRRAYLALSLMISGMDDQLDNETRASAIEQAEGLVKQGSTWHFVKARMLARPVPTGADIESARDIAIRSNATLAGILYQRVLDYRHAITIVLETWNEAAAAYFPSLERQVEAEKKLTDLGTFADTVSAIATANQNALNSVVVTYGQMSELRGVLGQGALLLNDFKSRLAKKLDAQLSNQENRERQLEADPANHVEYSDSVREALAGFKNRKRKQRSRAFKPDEAKEKVDHQIEAISKLIMQGNVTRANRYLSDLITFHVEHSEREHLGMSLCSLAKVAIDVHLFELAQRLVDYALMLGIDDVVIPSTQAQIMKSMGDFEKSLAVYEETIRRFPNDEVALGGYAEVLKSVGDFGKALAVYEETMDRFPNNEVLRNGYAGVLKSIGIFKKALEVYGQTMERFPNDAVAPSGYAEVLKSMGDFEKALEVYEEAMVRFPNSEVVRNGYAGVLKLMGNFEKALGVYKETTRRFPNDAVAPCGYAEVLKSIGDFEKALTVYEETMNRFPNNEVAPCGYAEVLKSMGDFEKALGVYEQTMDRFPNSAVVRNGYAGVLKSMGNFEKALGVYEQTMERFPNNEVAPCGHAEVLKSMGDFEKALGVYEQTMTRFKGGRISRHGYASVLMLLNRFEEVRSFLSGTQLRSEDDWIEYHIVAMSYLREGNTDEAIRRLTYGLITVPWPQQKSYFATALALSKIRKNQFDEVPEILSPNVANIDFLQRQTRLVLVGHSQAALGRKEEAVKTLAELELVTNPRVIDLKEAISRRYGLRQQPRTILSDAEASTLDARIYEQEFRLAA